MNRTYLVTGAALGFTIAALVALASPDAQAGNTGNWGVTDLTSTDPLPPPAPSPITPAPTPPHSWLTPTKKAYHLPAPAPSPEPKPHWTIQHAPSFTPQRPHSQASGPMTRFSPPPSQSAPPVRRSRCQALPWTVHSGDTVSLISRCTGHSWSQLREDNGLSSDYLLRIGQVIR